MTIYHNENATEGSFSITENGKQVALMTYQKPAEDRIVINHTEVDDSLRGTGTGKEMVAKAVAYAREKGLKVIPQCPFVAHVFRKENEWADVL